MRDNILISVDEPWDFIGIGGKNLIKGKIIKTFDESSLLFLSDKEETFEKNKGSLFIFCSRHVGETIYIIKDGTKHYNGTFNAFLITDCQYKEMSKEQLQEKSVYVFIGSF